MTQYEQDKYAVINFNGKPMSRAYYNLCISVRDVSLFSKGIGRMEGGKGIKAHRFWRLKDVKRYFGVTGGTLKVLEQLQAMQKSYYEDKNS
jgi:hypothetical protein